MWEDYSKSYLKNNRASGISVMVAALISAVLLSLLCSLFYNFWIYEIERLKREEGDWHSRITGELNEEDLTRIQNFASVERVEINGEMSGGMAGEMPGGMSKGREITVDIYFSDLGRVLEDTPEISALLTCEPEAVDYHYSLLAMYLIRDAKDTAPRAVFPVFLVITVMASISLIMIIHSSFAVSMNARIHQFGMLSSIGATPGQIRACLLQEAAALCIVPVIAGDLLGILSSVGVIKGINRIARDVPGHFDAVWSCHPLLLAAVFLVTVLTVWVSAWIPAGKMSRLTPLEAIKNTGELQLDEKKSSPVLTFLFGVEGELAGNAQRAQRKNLRTANFALMVSFAAFFLMQCFSALTLISQRMTYFARYQDAWDIMVTLKDTRVEDFGEIGELQALAGVQSTVAYQKAAAKRLLTEEELSGELWESGVFSGAMGEYVSVLPEGWLVNVPVVILDDKGFLEYCGQIGAPPRLDGAVILNRINGSLDPNFRIRNYIPYLKEDQKSAFLLKSTAAGQDNGLGQIADAQNGREAQRVEIPVLFYTQDPPVLKEAYDELDRYVLVHVLPVSLWKELRGQAGEAEADSYIRVLAKDGITLLELSELEEKMQKTLSGKYEVESVNRLQDQATNDQMIKSMMLIYGGVCVLLAMIGIGNVFSNTLGFVHQRKREFARYQSIGLTPEGMKKMFCIEALLIIGKPLLAALLLTAVATGIMIRAAYLEPVVFVREMPVVPILVFILGVSGTVALAYYLGGRKVLKSSLADALRDDTMM